MKRTVDPEDALNEVYGRGNRQSNAKSKVDMSDVKEDETVKTADREARSRAWHGFKKK